MPVEPPEADLPLLLTMGDAAGIGPEIILKALLADQLPAGEVVVVGDAAILQRAAAVLGYSCTTVANPQPLADCRLEVGGKPLYLAARSRLDPQQVPWGQISAAAGVAMRDYIQWACDQCLAGRARGLVTAPINKQALQLAGVPYPGHTELLAARCGGGPVVMMLAGATLRVALVTTHIALAQVPAALSRERILQTLYITHKDLCWRFALEQPRLAVLGLNPHAGEGGAFGDEEQRLIAPAIAEARQAGVAADGPHSPDSLFPRAVAGEYDAVICMYHDQGLIPLKLLHFADGVNVTLGLPIIRTSVDHGTAYELAGSGRADQRSLAAAVAMAQCMAANA